MNGATPTNDNPVGYDNPHTLARTATPLGGVVKRCFYVECGRCGKPIRSYDRSKKLVEQQLRAEGWRVTVQGWTCPDCLKPHTGEIGGAR